MHTEGNYHLLIEKIDVFIRRYYINKLLRGLIFWAAVLFSGYILATLGEYLGHFTTFLRSLIFYGFIILNLAIIARLVLPPLLAWLKLGNTIGHNEAAKIIGKHFTEIHDKLLNTLQLKTLADASPLHRQLIEASIDQKIETLRPVRFPTAVNIRDNVKHLKWIAAPLTFIIIIALAAPAVLTESTRRLIKHNEYFAPVAPFRFVVVNSTLNAAQGDDLKLNIELQGNQFPSAIYIETEDHTFKLDKQSLSKFSYQFSNLQKNTVFKLSGGGYSSQKYILIVNARPSLLRFDAALNYPAYLHKQNETISNAGDLTIPAGTVVNWTLHTQHANQVFFTLNGQKYALQQTANNEFNFSARIIKQASYNLKPVNKVVNTTDSAAYHITIIADEIPVITAEQKQDSVSTKALYFNGKIQDDHGFSALKFHYKVKSAETGKEISYSQPVKADLSHTQSDFFHYWNLKDLKAQPGDQISYYFEVADNDAVNGPKTARTAGQELKMPTQQQIAAELNTGTKEVEQKMESAAKIAAQLEREARQLSQNLLNKNNLSFDEKKQVEDLLNKRKELNDLVKQLQEDNQKNLYNRQQNQRQPEQITQMQNQMDKLLQNLLDPKTREMMEKLQELMQQEQKDGTRDELQKMQTDNKSMKKELDRMLELYKKLDFEQKLNQQIDQLNQLADQQQKLADQSKEQQANKQDIGRQQEKIKGEFQDIKKSLGDLEKTAAQNGQPQIGEPKKQEQQTDEQMDQAAKELQKNNMKKAADAQKQAAESMQQMGRKLKQDADEQESEEASLDARQLRELLKNLVNSSFAQEKLMQTFRSTNASDPNYVALSQQQKDIKDNLKTAEDSLYSLSKKVPQIQSTVNTEIAAINDHITQAIDNLGDRRTPEATRNQQYAMTAMNNLALMLNEVLDQLQNAMKNAKGGKGKKSKSSMQQMSQMQQQLNKNMQQMGEQMQQQGQNPGKSGQGQQGQSEQLAKMARQQQMIRQSLEQYNREATKDGSGAGNLDKIAKQMEQTENDLVNRRINEESLKRQQQIQTRLLEAEKAEQEREQDKQRLSQAGKEIPPGYIKALQNYQQQKTKQTEQLKTVSPELNLYYKQKVKKYFDQINGK